MRTLALVVLAFYLIQAIAAAFMLANGWSGPGTGWLPSEQQLSGDVEWFSANLLIAIPGTAIVAALLVLAKLLVEAGGEDDS